MFHLRWLAMCLVMLPGFGMAGPGGLTPILQLEYLHDEAAVQTITLYASDVDPNLRTVDDRYWLSINGKRVDVPETLVGRLDQDRRGYSYDAFTDGIVKTRAPVLCKLAGPAKGWVLSTAYLTYTNHNITDVTMRPVLTRPDNCLFTTYVRPTSETARFEASHAMAILKTLLDLFPS